MFPNGGGWTDLSRACGKAALRVELRVPLLASWGSSLKKHYLLGGGQSAVRVPRNLLMEKGSPGGVPMRLAQEVLSHILPQSK